MNGLMMMILTIVSYAVLNFLSLIAVIIAVLVEVWFVILVQQKRPHSMIRKIVGQGQCFYRKKVINIYFQTCQYDYH